MAVMGSAQTPLQKHRLGLVLLTAALALSACGERKPVRSAGDVPVARPAATLPKATENISSEDRYELAMKLMEAGKEAQARAELRALQAENFNSRRVATLLRQLDNSPRAIFGANSFAYTVQAGDTLFSLAGRYLGDPLNFYALAKFNNVSLPADLKPGTVLQIPGRSPFVDQQPKRVRRAPPVARAPRPAMQEAAPAAEPVVDRERAQRLRQQGLEQMTAGSIDRAVRSLSQAASLDPANGAIGADLARARRIQATVRNR